MNAHTSLALIKDAFYQVLDNTVFRVLVIMTMVLIAPTFLIGIKPEHVDVLFGMWKFTYAELGARGTSIPPDLNVRIIQTIQSAFVGLLAGNLGILFCLAATAFFVPRMLEKGEADTLFSKPVSRFVLLFARYTAGLLFVGLLAFVLVLGMHLGFLLRSGFSDPGFLWSALTLVYVFAIAHAFSTLMGVMTRSSVAALLLAILFFVCNGGFQFLWVLKEHSVAVDKMRAASVSDDNPDAAKEGAAGWLRAVYLVQDVVHYVLPKTNDADVLTQKLRQVVAGDSAVLEDRIGKLAVTRDPAGLQRGNPVRDVDLSAAPAAWTASEDGKVVARVTIARRSRINESKSGGKTRKTRMSASTASMEFLKSLDERSNVAGKPVRTRFPAGTTVRDRVSWSEQQADGLAAHERAFLALDDWMYEIDFEAEPTWLARGDHEKVWPDFLEELEPRTDSPTDLDAGDWYAKQVDWAAPLKFNAFFSLGSSIAFALVCLLLARWRLSRIDF